MMSLIINVSKNFFMKMCYCIYFGIFDFIMYGYFDVFGCVVKFFDKVMMVIVYNLGKGLFFSFEECVEMIWLSLVKLLNVEIMMFGGLLVDFVVV